MSWSEHDADDESAGPLVRPYAMTHGRTRASADFDLITLVVAARSPHPDEFWEPEHLSILELAQRPVSVAELAARMNVPAGVVRVLLDDLRAQGALIVRAASLETSTPNLTILKAVADGLRAL
ncbi:DUF742 domain-containing protein [Planosporangium mesophilum]|uniref:DUF742 domain-containing protein n=1 Tax=Planosporangium mesophilum TaxID=689768 RepID=A0A8J3TED0_9ACTN|nr:DUF742 domain-containing protein [Planosporangium mesophilum]NJC84913.1 DUF742 domain-containing protein [Planosporangium mesophilum]GII23622.1 hypothetical protein Pme01_32190 [Planosporangium mesophilum]